MRPLMDLAQHCGWWLPYRHVVIASEKPEVIHLESNRLHCDGGPAIRYRDGWSIWALNGVRVSKEIAETPAEKLPVQYWLDEQNVEVRGEIEKKIGTERILAELDGHIIDQEVISIGGRDLPYRLEEIKLKNGDRRRLLVMENATTSETHKEWVPLRHPEDDKPIDTARAALSWQLNDWPADKLHEIDYIT